MVGCLRDCAPQGFIDLSLEDEAVEMEGQDEQGEVRMDDGGKMSTSQTLYLSFQKGPVIILRHGGCALIQMDVDVQARMPVGQRRKE
jgi:hypothetical protein